MRQYWINFKGKQEGPMSIEKMAQMGALSGKGCIMLKRMFGTVACGVWVAAAAISPSEVVSLPGDAAYGGGDKVGSQLVAATYNAGEGPGIWIVADGGYRLYHNGALLAEDNQAGRVRFVPMTFLPGENAACALCR